MQVSNNYIVVEPLEKPVQEGFTKVEVQDDFVYRGRVAFVPETPVYMGNTRVMPGDTVLFAKYSPDTHEIDHEGKKLKFVSTRDILARI